MPDQARERNRSRSPEMSSPRAMVPAAEAWESARGRHRLAWTREEAEGLVNAYHRGDTVAALALAHGRTTGAIEHQLVKMEVLEPDACQYGGAPRDRRAPSRAK